MRVLVLYNIVRKLENRAEKDLLCERDIIVTAKEVGRALSDIGHKVDYLTANDNLYENLKKIKRNIDIVFNLAEGITSDTDKEIYVPMILDLLNVPYTGSNGFAINTAYNKALVKNLAQAYNILTPRFHLYHRKEEIKKNNLKFPQFVKPQRGGGGIGINNKSVVNSHEELEKQVNFILEKYKKPALVEEFIDGDEVTVTILGNYPNLTFLPPVGITFQELPKHTHPIFSYEAKWIPKSKIYKNYTPIPNPKIKSTALNNLKTAAAQIYQAVNVRDYGRLDFILKNDKLYFLEINPNPDISKSDLHCPITAAFLAQKMTYHNLIKIILESAMMRYHK